MNMWTALIPSFFQDSQVAGVLLDASVKSFILLLVAGVVCLCWRRASASTRHLVWLLAMAGLLCLPVVSRLLPVWQRPLWAVSSHADSLNELTTLTLQLGPAAGSVPRDRSPALSSTFDSLARGERTVARPHLAMRLGTGWITAAFILWVAGIFILLLSFASAGWSLRRFRRAAQPPTDPGLSPLLEVLRKELRLHRPVLLLQSADNMMPVTWGWWRPVILLPLATNDWTAVRRRVVLLHELAHVKRWDCLTQMAARLACALYWFNPLVWIAARRMCVERERACDDLVLNVGCKASDYASHLVEIARSFRHMPQLAAIAMARPSNLQGRIAAIVDASRPRRAPRALVAGICAAMMLAFAAAVAGQKTREDAAVIGQAALPRPWFDERLRAFFAAKAAQARELGRGQAVAPEVRPYFEAGIKGDWNTTTNLWLAMRARAHQYEGSRSDETLDKVWSPILETDLAWEQFANWKEKYVLAFGNDIIGSIPPGSIYFGGTDPGRGVITAMSESHAEAKPFFTITQNALADGTYLDYLQAMYGQQIYMATSDDSQRCFQAYTNEALRRLNEGKLKPGENVSVENGTVQVKGQIAVMAVNALIAKVIFDRNPDREFYIEESFPLDWMYPHLTPNGLILKINRQPLPALSEDTLRQDHQYWSQYLRPMLGDWLKDETSVSQVAGFVERLYLQHDLGAFNGDPQFLQDTWAQKAFSKLRSSIGGVYSWRAEHAKTEAEKQRMAGEADFAFRQAIALCPASPEAVFRYANLLVSLNRVNDARVVAETGLKFDRGNTQIADLVENLKTRQPK